MIIALNVMEKEKIDNYEVITINANVLTDILIIKQKIVQNVHINALLAKIQIQTVYHVKESIEFLLNKIIYASVRLVI